jgi:AraC-like DNA-binding protein
MGMVAAHVVTTRWTTDRSEHETASREPEGPARRAVRGYVGYEEWPSEPMTRRELARNGPALILAFGDALDVHDGGSAPARRLRAFVIGNQSQATFTGLGGHQQGVQVELTSSGALALFGRVGELNDAAVPIDEVLGRFGTELVERLWSATTWEDRFDLLDGVFDERSAGRAGGLTPEVQWLKHQLALCGGRGRVEPLMDETGWSRRVVTERFRLQIGVSPKAFARILRFTRAAAMLRGTRTDRPLAEVAVECGYYDQSHLNRDFSALAGCSPTAYLAETAGEPGVRFFQDDGEDPSLP